MIQQGQKNENRATARTPEARYAYYRRCQVFKRNGAQCKAPAEKGSHICHAHAGQLAMAVRRERERQAVLAEAVAEMRRRGRPECEMADLFTDFKGIQVTTAVMARAVIAGRIDCKTAGRLVVQLQTVSKLLRVYHRAHRGTQRGKASTTKDTKKHEGLPQICADERRLDRPEKAHLTTETLRHGEQPKNLSLINAGDTDLKKPARGEDQSLTAEARRRGEQPESEKDWAVSGHEEMRITLVAEVRAVAERRGWAHAPPELLRAA